MLTEGYIEDLLQQTIACWEPGSPNMYGQYEYESPRTLPARWEDKEEQFLGEGGELKGTRSIVYTLEEVPLGSKIVELSQGESPPSQPSDAALQVKRVEKIPALDMDFFLYKALLV